ncbi:MAG TPA: tRNA (guanosine(46)-N7)-methyltransferase TrmB, partial [Opitutae bacterium]|nr:tRNA (guanosine(46)-N7)-methyltransferase TrmB [Opitutae bacterium]
MCSKGQLWAETQRANRVEALRTLITKEIGESDTITLEIGCGHGHWLTAYGAEHANEKCVGIDLLNDRLKKSEAKRAKRGLTNVHFMKAEASEF